MAFLKTILIILLVYYLLVLLGKWLLPRFLGYAAKRTEKHFREQFGQFHREQSNNPTSTGNISVDRSGSRTQRKSSTQVGDYIEFEEID